MTKQEISEESNWPEGKAGHTHSAEEVEGKKPGKKTDISTSQASITGQTNLTKDDSIELADFEIPGENLTEKSEANKAPKAGKLKETYELELPVAPAPAHEPFDANQIVERDIYCLRCSYNLRGARKTCPECGLPFNLHKASTWSYEPQKPSPLANIAIFREKKPRKYHSLVFAAVFLVGQVLMPLLCVSFFGYLLWLYLLAHHALRATDEIVNNFGPRLMIGAAIGMIAFAFHNLIAGDWSIIQFQIPLGVMCGMLMTFIADYFHQ